MGAVAAGHATDLWGVGLVTLGVLCAVAFYGGSLGPVGHGVRVGMGDLLGWGRFLLPPVLIAVGVRMLMGRGDDPEGEPNPERRRAGSGASAEGVWREPARAVIGGTLVLLSVSGMAALAGGSPALRASTGELSAAGGWVGAAVVNQLGHGLGGFGAAVVLAVVAVVGILVFTGVSVRTAASGFTRAVRWLVASARGDRSGAAVDDVTDEPTDPFGRALADGRQPSMAAVAHEVVDEPAAERVEVIDDAHDPLADDVLEPVVLPEAATRPGKGEQLEMRMSPSAGAWKLPPANLLKRAKAQVIDETEVDAAGAALVHALAAHGVDTRLVGRTVGPTVTRYELELGAE
jgi:S-DNA-T family DNA segregation ATPase FtsK/SpoIIIE